MTHFAHEEQRYSPKNNKFFPSVLKDACAQCHGFCVRTRVSLSSEEESPMSDIDNKQVIVLEVQSRAMKAKLRPRDHSIREGLCWVFSPTTGKLLIAPKSMQIEENEEYDDEKETFFSVRSCFSHCSSEGGANFVDFWGRSILEEFHDCEGWPFGLYRKAVMLPPLPSSPSDSWIWRRRNLIAKI